MRFPLIYLGGALEASCAVTLPLELVMFQCALPQWPAKQIFL
jgi:hypothetical protein